MDEQNWSRIYGVNTFSTNINVSLFRKIGLQVFCTYAFFIHLEVNYDSTKYAPEQQGL